MQNKIILAIESSGKICSVSLHNLTHDENIFTTNNIAEYTINIGNKHDKFLAELCNRIVKDNDLTFDQIDAVAVSIGPGSFTGLRVGLSIAKGLCFSRNTKSPNSTPKLIAVPTMDALAYRLSASFSVKNIKEINILSVIPSHSNLAYHQLFDKFGVALSDIKFDTFDAIHNQFDNDILVTTNYEINLEFDNYFNDFKNISANTIGTYAAKLFFLNMFTNPSIVQPLYYQEFVPK